jgi:hypothetical protein
MTEDKANLVKSSEPVNSTAPALVFKESVSDDLEQDAEASALEIREFKDVIQHRKKWSDALLALVRLIIIMDFVIMILVGLGILKYGGNYVLPAFIASSVLEIFGLSYIVVQYLFPSPVGTTAKKPKR